MAVNDKLNLLKKVDLFSQFGQEELEIVARYSEYRTYSKGGEIFREGSSGAELFVVSAGEVLISKSTEEDRRRDVARYLPGESFGELSLFENAPRTASATAETETTLLIFPTHDLTLAEIFEKHDYISAQMLHKLMALISSRIRRTNLLISEKTQWVEELRRQILNDKLTGLYNRTFIEEEFVSRFSEYGEVMAILAVKPDNFKLINDTYGHDAGDRVLRMMADAVRAGMGEKSTAVRYRGDEYMVILPDKGIAEARTAARTIMERILKLDTAAVTDGTPVSITVSIGIAEFPGDEKDPKSLVENAYKRMWDARESGGDRIIPPAE